MADTDQSKTRKKMEQNDPDGNVLKSKKSDLLCGGMHQISIFRPSVIIDSHMHIQSGNCAPLPFLWDKTPVIGVFKTSRGVIEGVGMGLGAFLDFIMLKPAVGAVRKAAGSVPNENNGYYRKNALRLAVPEAKKPTNEIGEDFIAKKEQAHAFFLGQEHYKDLTQLLLSCVVMTMDMEYAHIDGYFGIKVYNPVYADADFSKDPIHYWYPRHGVWSRCSNTYERVDEKRPILPEKGQTLDEFNEFNERVETQGITGAYHDNHTHREKLIRIKAVPCLADSAETARYERWTKQLQHTEQVILANPLKLLPLFHYDPRRWQLKGNQEVYNHVGSEGLYLGYKIYTAQGYRPWDIRRLPIMKDFYVNCCEKQTPIMNHCTPEGAPTFDWDEYFDFMHPNDNDEDRKQKDEIVKRYAPAVQMAVESQVDFAFQKKLEYFNEQFIAPDAWRQVLDSTVNGTRLNTLRLCLAHFGGNTCLGRKWGEQIIEMMKKYPNLFADISSSFADKGFRKYFIRKILKGKDGELVKDRILFGTDWYLTLLGGLNYVEFCQKAKEDLDDFDSSLWFRLTQYNPYNFYRLKDDDQIGRIATNIIKRKKAVEIEDDQGPIKQNVFDEITKEAAYIKQASIPYYCFKETP